MPRLFLTPPTGVREQIKRLGFRDATGTIRMLKRLFLCDAGGVPRLIFVGVQVLPLTVSGLSQYPAAASAGVAFTSDGTQWEQSNQTDGSGAGTPQSAGSWDPGADGTNYDIRATLLSGTAPNWPGYTNTLNVWIQPTASLFTASWGIQVSNRAGADESCVLRFDIAPHGTTVVVASGQVTLEVSQLGA